MIPPRFTGAHKTCVFASDGANDPACACVFVELRAVSWKPHACCVVAGSEMVTIRCCFTAAAYVCPLGNATVTLPCPELTVPTWHPDCAQVPFSPGTPQ